MTKVAIVTVNYNGKKDTLELLDSLKKLPTTNYQLLTIVVDNGSEDGLVNELVKNYPEVDILQNGTNKGFAGGYNRGIDYAYVWGADYILIINNDCLLKDANLIDELIKTAESDPKIGIVSPKIYFAKGFEFHKDRYSPDQVGKVIWYGGGSFDWNNIQAIHRGLDEVDKGKYDEVSEQGIISGACVLIKKEVFEEIGGFDEKYFLYFEDSDFIKRAHERSFKTYYNGTVSIYHKVSQSTGIGSKVTDYYHTRNRLIFGMQYGKFRTRFALLREALWLFLFGRKAQRQGILDFYLGERVGANVIHLEGGLGWHPKVEYPLKLSIGIVSYNTADLTKKLLESIFNPGVQSYLTPGVKHVRTSGFDPESMEIIVLDNGSKDNCKKVIEEFLPKIKFIQNQKNEGFSKGYNKAIRFSKGEYILMLNSDIEVMGSSLSEMVKWAEHFNGQAVLGGKLVFPDGSDQDSVFHLPTIWGAFNEYFLDKKGSYFMYLPKGDQPSSVEGMVMACFLIPWNIINKVGLLDEGTFIFFEDIEYARRLKQAGIPLYFVPTAKFIHHHGGATKRIGETKAYKLLKLGAIHYHGLIYYHLLSFILWLGQKLGRVKTPISRWTTS